MQAYSTSLVSGSDSWLISETDLNPGNAAVRETIFAQANGYRCFRGSSPFLRSAVPGNYLAGIFDRADAPVTELANCPDPLPIAVFVDAESVRSGMSGFYDYSRVFDLRRGTVTAKARFRAKTGAQITLETERFVSFADRSRWGERWTVTALNFSRSILIKTGIDGTVRSNQSHPMDFTKHYEVLSVSVLGDDRAMPNGIQLVSRTHDRRIEIAEALTLTGPDNLRLVKSRQFAESVEAVWELPLEAGVPVTFYRLGTTASSRDLAEIDDRGLVESHILGMVVAERNRSELKSFLGDGFQSELRAHEQALSDLWRRIDIEIDGDPRAQLGLRYNLFQLSLCASGQDPRVSIGAKGLHGEGYKGHVFWDTETFMLPFFIFTQPETARNLLRYRALTLEGARRNARKGGHSGARFAWESADSGDETTPRWGLDPGGNQVRILCGDKEAHINADIAYAILKYFQVSGDDEFMKRDGLGLLFEIAAFWADFVVWNADNARFEIRDVIGPDEFHEHDVHNNTYTNYLVKWALLKTAELAERLSAEDPELLDAIMERSGIDIAAPARWREIAGKLFIPIDAENELIEQFEGYFSLKEFPITEWDVNGMPLWPKGADLTRLGETTLIKQPDVVMLFALLGEDFSRETKIRNYEFYEKRTMHKSSLSPSIYAMMGLSLGKTDHAYDYFIKAVETDLVDNQRNTAQGIHAANMGGVWQTAVFGFGGLSVDGEGRPCVDPWLPPNWNALRYRFIWRNNPVIVEARRNLIRIRCESSLDIAVRGTPVFCEAGRETEIEIEEPRDG